MHTGRHAADDSEGSAVRRVDRKAFIDRAVVPFAAGVPPFAADAPRAARIPPEGVKLDELVNAYERSLLLEALEQARGVKKRAAQRLGISFRSFRYRWEKLGLEPDDEA